VSIFIATAMKIDTYASIAPPSQHNTHITEHFPPLKPHPLIVVITKTIDDEISPLLHNRINLTNTNTVSDENLMMAGIGQNM